MKIPKNVYVFDNGTCIVFDAQGQQIGHLNGQWAKTRHTIRLEANHYSYPLPALHGAEWDSASCVNAIRYTVEND